MRQFQTTPEETPRKRINSFSQKVRDPVTKVMCTRGMYTLPHYEQHFLNIFRAAPEFFLVFHPVIRIFLQAFWQLQI